MDAGRRAHRRRGRTALGVGDAPHRDDTPRPEAALPHLRPGSGGGPGPPVQHDTAARRLQVLPVPGREARAADVRHDPGGGGDRRPARGQPDSAGLQLRRAGVRTERARLPVARAPRSGVAGRRAQPRRAAARGAAGAGRQVDGVDAGVARRDGDDPRAPRARRVDLHGGRHACADPAATSRGERRSGGLERRGADPRAQDLHSGRQARPVLDVPQRRELRRLRDGSAHGLHPAAHERDRMGRGRPNRSIAAGSRCSRRAGSTA